MASPWKRVTLFSSFFQPKDTEDFDLVLSDLARYFQDNVSLTFTADGPVRYRANDIGVILGANVRMDERTDAGFSYSFNRVKSRYGTNGSASRGIEMIEGTSRIVSDIHRVGANLGRRLRAGIRVTTGYHLDIHNDRSPVDGTGTVQPFDLGTYQHTVTLGITLSNELLD